MKAPPKTSGGDSLVHSETTAQGEFTMKLLTALATGFLLLGGFAGTALAQPEAAPSDDPQTTVRKIIDEVRKMRATKDRPKTKHLKKKNEAASHVLHYLQMERLARRMVGPTWKELDDPGRKRFLQLLEKLFRSVVLPKGAEFFGTNLQITYEPSSLRGKRATVAATANHPTEGTILLEFKLRLHNAEWKLQDILLDEVSLARQLQKQARKIVEEQGFEELVKRLEQKIEDESAKFSSNE